MSTISLDHTHDPGARSWVVSANDGSSDFPIQNLPFGRFRRVGDTNWRIGTAIGNQVLDLRAAHLTDTDDMNRLMGISPPFRQALRHAIFNGLRHDSPHQAEFEAALVPQAAVEMGLPCTIGDYTDFYTSIHHATTVGRQFRPDNPLLPNYKWVPIGYHGRASSIGVSGQAFHRPMGQSKAPQSAEPSFGPSRKLDFELELAAFIATPNRLGEPVTMAEAESHLFGLALFNDWSARDLQGWEYQPLGPFLSKNFASTVSPWIVTMEALQPFRLPFTRAEGDPQPLPYLDSLANRAGGAIGIELEVWLQTETMRRAGQPGVKLMQSDFRDAYWSLAQLVAHHTVNGCNLQSGDLLGTGTLSGPAPEQGGSLLELSAGGQQPLQLGNGESRAFLEDGDTVILRAHCARNGARRIGFGECRGSVLPAKRAATT